MRPAPRPPQERAVAVTLFSLLEEGVVVEVEVARLQVRIARARLRRNQLRVGDREHEAVEVGELAPALIDAVEVRVAHGDEAIGRRPRRVVPGLQRRQVRVVALVEVVHAVMHRGPPARGGALGFRLLHLRRVLLVELLEVMRRPEDEKRRGARHARQEMRVGLLPAIAHRDLVEHLELRGLAVDQHVARRTRGAQLAVIRYVLPVVAEVLGGEGMAVGPAMPLTQAQREDALFLHVERLEDVRHQRAFERTQKVGERCLEQRLCAGHAPGERVERAAMAPGLRSRLAERHDERLLRQALFDRRQLAGTHRLRERRRLDVRPRCAGEQQKCEQPSHARARTRCSSPTCTMPGAEPLAIRNSLDHAAGSEALPCMSASKSSLRPRSGSGTAASNALV